MDWKDFYEALGRARSGMEVVAGLGRSLEERLMGLMEDVAPGREDPVLLHLVSDGVAELVRRTSWSTLVLNPGSTSTKLAVYNGLRLIAIEEVKSEEGADVQGRAQGIADWISSRGMSIKEVSGIAARGGFMAPTPTGTYEVSRRMVEDLDRATIRHASNLAVPVALRLAEMSASSPIVTVTDAVSCDEAHVLHRITGSASLRSSGSGAHYLNLKAIAQLCARVLGVEVSRLHLGLCQMGGGMSAMRMENGTMVQVVSAFGNIPSANRSGRLPLYELLCALEDGHYGLDKLRAELAQNSGGLVALCGTDSFLELQRALADEARPLARAKMELVEEWFAVRVATHILELCATGRPLDIILLSGGLAHNAAFCQKVRERIPLSVPVARVPGSIEYQALAAGLLKVSARPSSSRSYSEAVELFARKRVQEDALLDTVVFESRKAGEPQSLLRSLDAIIEAARPGEGELPIVAIAGADNEEALLAARLAAGDPANRLARFVLIGPYARISQLTWELDVPIDDETFFVVDSDDPVQTAVELLDAQVADIMMKGSVMTAGLLKGYFGSLKARGLTGGGLVLSHFGLFEIPGRKKLVAVSDAAINPEPTVAQRIKILENALLCLHDLGLARPKVAVISATEKVSAKVASSMDALEIVNAFVGRDDVIVEGPLSVDLSLSPESAREKGYKGQIRGDADLLLVPTLDVGNAAYKSFTVTGRATIAGAVVGGDRPLVLTSRGDSARSKLSSIALALVLARAAKERIKEKGL